MKSEWNKSINVKPHKEEKYQVLIDCDGETKQSFCTYFVTKKRFHFDMPNINWKVTHWK